MMESRLTHIKLFLDVCQVIPILLSYPGLISIKFYHDLPGP